MKRLLISLFIALPVAVMANQYDDVAKDLLNKKINKKNAIAVMPFTYDKDKDTGKFIAEEMTKSLVNAGAKVVERSQVDKILKEHKIQQTGLISDEDAAQIGKGLGAKYIVIGTASIIRKPGFSNDGIKVNARIIDVQTFQVLSASGTEVDAEDKISTYKNQGPRKSAEYPAFLGFYGGANFLHYTGYYDDEFTDVEHKASSDLNTGFMFGIRYLNENKGFFTKGYELYYIGLAHSESEYYIRSLNFNIPLVLRLPLYNYMPSLPDLTNLYFGPSLGLTLSSNQYKDPKTLEKKSAYGIGFNLYVFLGLQIGFSENVSLFAEYRYLPEVINHGYHIQDNGLNDTILYTDKLSGHNAVVGFYFAP